MNEDEDGATQLQLGICVCKHCEMGLAPDECFSGGGRLCTERFPPLRLEGPQDLGGSGSIPRLATQERCA